MTTRKVHVRLGSAAVPVGELLVDAPGNGRATSMFTYDPSWLARPGAFALAPDMELNAAPIYTTGAAHDACLPGPIADGGPDSWGKAIIKVGLGRPVESELDYLLESDDGLRSGALRYYDDPGPDARPLAQPRTGAGRHSVPRLLDLEQVIAEARAFEADPIHYREHRARLVGGELLRNAVGSLGGARPKVNARDEDDALWIVKLAKADDAYAVARAEVLALRLAKRVGIRVAEANVLPSGDRFPVAVVKRFDRGANGSRIPFISAQTFMGLPGAEPGNYVDIAFRMRTHAADPVAEMRELYRRMMFNVLAQNTDDHLRNLGFLYRGQGKWGLSPAYDVNPVPDHRPTLKTAISELHGTALDIEAVIEAAPYFEVKPDEAAAQANAMALTIRDEWRMAGARLGMTASDLKAVAPALENEQIGRAIALGEPTAPGARIP